MIRNARRTIVVGLVIVGSAVALHAASGPGGGRAKAADWRIHPPVPVLGLAQVEITVDPRAAKVRLAGYGARFRKLATGVLDPVYAHALVGADARGRLFGIVSLDLCWVPTELRDRVLAKLADRGFTASNLLMAATHTHSSLAGRDRTALSRLLFGPFDEALTERTAARVAEAVARAQESMVPARWEIATVRLPGMNRSRLDPAFDVGQSAYGQGLKPDPGKYRVDDRLTVLRFTTVEGKPLGALVHYAAHPTILSDKNLNISADWPGVVYRRVAEALGPETVTIVLNGTEGDTAPLPDWQDDVNAEVRQVQEYGNRVADEVLKALPQTRPMKSQDVATSLAVRPLANVVMRSLRGWKMPLSFSRLFYARPEAPFQAFRLGDLVFLALPGEPTTQVGADMMALCSPDDACRVVGLSNGYLGYLVTPQEYAGGTYAADSSFFGPHEEDMIRDGVRAALDGLR